MLDLIPVMNALFEVLEVSIGHSLIAHALEVGLQKAVRDYLAVLNTPARAA